MKRIIFIALSLLFVAPAVNAETKEEKAARIEAQKKAQELAKKKAELEKKIKQAEWKKNNELNNLKNLNGRLENNVKAQKTANDRINSANKSLEKALKRRADLKRAFEDKANEKQLQDADLAAKKQETLNGMIDMLRKVLEEDEAKLEKLQKQEYKDNELVKEDAQQKTITEAYELAKQLEQEITESYKDLKATQTAITHKMSFEAAQKITDVAKPERIEANQQALEMKPRNKEDLDKQKEAQKEIIVETDKMVEATVAMMEEAMEIVMKGDDKNQMEKKQRKEIRWLEEKDFEEKDLQERLDEMEAEADFQVIMDRAAAEDDKQKAKDLAAMMNEMNANKKQDDDKKEEEKKKDAELAKKMAKAAEDAKNSKPPPLDPKDPGLLPGNVLMTAPDDKSEIPNGSWMFVSSWYVIGPFPNPNRINLRRKFPPESVVDLNATYSGKDGRVLKWTFMQAKNQNTINQWGQNCFDAAEVIPDRSEEYAIYYAYAEVFFDKECDRWVAIGSDDRSDVWLNDFHIWGSSNKLKGWKLNEDYRRVHFKKGRNKILLRCENGHWNLGWSMCIATGDGKPDLPDNKLTD